MSGIPVKRRGEGFGVSAGYHHHPGGEGIGGYSALADRVGRISGSRLDGESRTVLRTGNDPSYIASK